MIERIVNCGLLDSGGGLNPFTSGVVRSAMELGLVDENLAHLKDTYSRRMQAMCAALRSELPASAHFTEPSGGFFIWLSLPEGRDTLEISSQSQRAERGVHAGPEVLQPAGAEKLFAPQLRVLRYTGSSEGNRKACRCYR